MSNVDQLTLSEQNKLLELGILNFCTYLSLSPAVVVVVVVVVEEVVLLRRVLFGLFGLFGPVPAPRAKGRRTRCRQSLEFSTQIPTQSGT